MSCVAIPPKPDVTLPRKTLFRDPLFLSLPFGEAFSLWCGTNYYFALPLGFDQHNEAVPRVSIFVEVLMPGCIASEPRCGRGIGDHGAGQHRSLRHAGSEKKLVYAD